MIDLLRLARRHRQQLGLARTLHRDEPERSLVDRLSDGEQAVVLVDRCFAGGEGGRQLLAGVDVEHHRSALGADHGVVLVEHATSWVSGSSGMPSETERLAVHRVRVRRGDDVGSRPVDRRVDHERRPVERGVALDDLALVVHEQQIARPHLPKLFPNGLTQKWSGRSGSRTVMCPATPSAKPNLPKMRSAPASLALRWALLVSDVVERRRSEYRPRRGRLRRSWPPCRLRSWGTR